MLDNSFREIWIPNVMRPNQSLFRVLVPVWYFSLLWYILTDQPFSSAAKLLFWVSLLGYFAWSFRQNLRARGPQVSSLSQPNPQRLAGLILLGFWIGLIGLSAFIGPVQGELIWFMMLPILLAPRVTGRRQFHENGLWEYDTLIPWNRFSSYSWREGNELVLWYGKKPWILANVPDTDRPAIEALLAQNVSPADEILVILHE